MNERSTLISKLKDDRMARAAYIKSKLGVLVPSQIRALRFKSNMPRQSDLAEAAAMQQSQISMFETPGAANVTLATLARLAAAFKVGLVVKFVPFSEMLQWENAFAQDEFNVVRLDEDIVFHTPIVQSTVRGVEGAAALIGNTAQILDDQAAKQATISGKREGLPHYSPRKPAILMEAAGQCS
jgi:transcriptional regulator with XRE-family HTH domain